MNQIEQNLRSSGLTGAATVYVYALAGEQTTVAFIASDVPLADGADKRLSCVHAHFVEANRSVMHCSQGSITATMNALGYELISKSLDQIAL